MLQGDKWYFMQATEQSSYDTSDKSGKADFPGPIKVIAMATFKGWNWLRGGELGVEGALLLLKMGLCEPNSDQLEYCYRSSWSSY